MKISHAAIVLATTGEGGNHRPFLVVQSDLYNETHNTITVCPMTSVVGGEALFRAVADVQGGRVVAVQIQALGGAMDARTRRAFSNARPACGSVRTSRSKKICRRAALASASMAGSGARER